MYRPHADGARGELIAAAWFLHRGWMVFRNVSAHGPADLTVARMRRSGVDVQLIEVRYGSINTRIRELTDLQKRLGVSMAMVGSDGSVEWTPTTKGRA